MPKINVSPEILEKLKELNMDLDQWAREQLRIKKEEGLRCKFGVVLPEGSILLGSFKDDVYKARVTDGALKLEGEGLSAAVLRKSFPNITAAASAITENPVKTTSGWEFWTHVRYPGWKELTFLLGERDDFEELMTKARRAVKHPGELEQLMSKIREE